MRPRHVGLTGLLVAALATGGVAYAHGPAPMVVETRAGAAPAVIRALGMSALRVERRHGNRLQVHASPRLARALERQPGVAQVTAAQTGFDDEGVVLSQGLRRTGAEAVIPAADGGAGLTIAIVDLGFGTNIAALQARDELPPADRVEQQSFDPVNGLEGRNAYGNPTNHGELVAQTVYDYAPKARYIFVNYRTTDDFVAAVEWLATRPVDIVVHSNSFITGPFDGSSVAAQAVDRAAARGVLWFNSAGNYRQKHWGGAWNDSDGDGVHEFTAPDGGMFYRQAGSPLTFALSWRSPGDRASDLNLYVDRRTDDGAGWVAVAGSANRQTIAGAPGSERIVGYSPPSDGFFRVRIERASGPPPASDMTLFTRELDMAVMGGGPGSSIPTPGDAAGAVAVGATDWRGLEALRPYSSVGPTDDGRIKPDLVAPTDTSIASVGGTRLVGGTSNAAPNAAGAAAVFMAAVRRSGRTVGAADVRAYLTANAFDLGAPGPDMEYGHGRVRVDLNGPVLRRVAPAVGMPVRGVVVVGFLTRDRSAVASAEMGVGDRMLSPAIAGEQLTARLDTRRLPDGPYTLWVTARDTPGNTTRAESILRVDNTPPVVQVRGTRQRGRAADRTAPRPTWLGVSVRDAGGGRVQVAVRGVGRTRTPVAVRPGRVAWIPIGAYARGRARLTVTATDQAGNARTVRATVRVGVGRR